MDVVAELPGLRPVRRFLPKNKMVAARLPEAPIAGLAEPVPDAAAAIVPDSDAATVAEPTAVSVSPAVLAADAAPSAGLQRHSPEPAPVQAPLAAVVAGNALAARGPALITPGASMAWKPPPPAGSAAATPAVAADGAEGDGAPARKARLIDFCTAFRNKRQKRLPGAVKAVVVKAEETPAAAAAARAAAAREAAFAPASARFVGAAVPGFANSLQVQFVDGKMVLIESTMEIGDQRPQETVDWEEIEESGEPTATACSFAPKRARSERWSAEDTRKFFRCLQRCGTDFSLMEEQFQFTRSRRQLKNKFNSEERRNPALISKALLAALPMDMTDFEERQRKAEADAAAKKRPRRDRLNTMQSTAATVAGGDGDGGKEGGGGGSGGDAEGASAEGATAAAAAAAAAAEEERMRVDAEKEEEELIRDPLARPRSSAGAAPAAAAEASAPAAAAAAAAAAPPEAPRATAEVAAAEALVAVGSARQAVPAAAVGEGESADGVHEEDAAREHMRAAEDPLMFPGGAAAAAAGKPVPRHRPKPKSCKA